MHAFIYIVYLKSIGNYSFLTYDLWVHVMFEICDITFSILELYYMSIQANRALLTWDETFSFLFSIIFHSFIANVDGMTEWMRKVLWFFFLCLALTSHMYKYKWRRDQKLISRVPRAPALVKVQLYLFWPPPHSSSFW